MNLLLFKISSFFRYLKSKIAFYPSLFAIFGLSFALFMMFLESKGISKFLRKHVPALFVDNGDTALTILSACITGLISMMVFSFSMVMVLLNQASTNYSPRLLPGLVSEKNHQIILGIYLSSILYCIFILFSIQPTGEKYLIPGFSVLLGVVAVVIAMYAFIYFIHNISENIKISKILDGIFLTARNRLTATLKSKKQDATTFPGTDNWFEYEAGTQSYFQDYSEKNLVKFCKKHNTEIEILKVKGSFLPQGVPLLKSRKKLDQKEEHQLLRFFYFTKEEHIDHNYVLAFKQITEIIVKAMSPGINDPGTAINGIDYLSELFRLCLLKADEHYISREGKMYVKEKIVDFHDLLYNLMASIRTYCKHDIVVVQKLGHMFLNMVQQKVEKQEYLNIIEEEAERLFRDAQSSIQNPKDVEIVEEMANNLKKIRVKE